MKKVSILIVGIICTIGLVGCEFRNSVDTMVAEQSDKLGDVISEKMSVVGDEIGECIDEKISTVMDDTKEEIVDDILDKVGIQMDQLVEYSPGIWFEEAEKETYEKNGIKMNAFWEISQDDVESSSDSLKIEEDVISSQVPDGAIVTITFFEKIPETVKVFEQNGDLGEAIEVSKMENPLTGKATYSFFVLYKEQVIKEYTLLSKFKNMDDGLLELIFYKE
jgi:hypothetical protein